MNKLAAKICHYHPSIHPNIRSIIETEEDKSLPFLSVLVKRKPDETLGHMVC
jgi:hypothetical protein